MLLEESVIEVVGIANLFFLARLRRRNSHTKATRSKTPPAEAMTIPTMSPVVTDTPEEVDDTFGVGVVFVNPSDVAADEELLVLVVLKVVLVLVDEWLDDVDAVDAVDDDASCTSAVDRILQRTKVSDALYPDAHVVYDGQHAWLTPAASCVQLTAPGCPQSESKSA